MNPGFVVKLRPAGPWRIGPDSGARNRVDVIYHSDSLYSAVTWAMVRLGALEEWLEATARCAAPAVSFGSCFPFFEDITFVVPPRTIWPPALPAAGGRMRWKSARFVPTRVVETLLAGGQLDANAWEVDGASECLVPAGRPGPFRSAVRWAAAVDRLSGAAERFSTACLEFRSGAGLWAVVSFTDESARERWTGPLQAAFRLLSDTGFGGERSRGWGRAETPEFIEGLLPGLILRPSDGAEPVIGGSHWLLSLFTPAASDSVDWSRGDYALLARGGRVESPAGSGELKKQLRMVAEGSVLVAPAPLCGSAPDVAPDGFAHPVFRSGFAVSIPLGEVSA